MNWRFILGAVSSLSLFVPIVLIILLKLYHHRSFLALMIYYFSVGFYNLISLDIISVPQSLSRSSGILNNLLDAPLMLLFLVFFSTSVAMKKRIHLTILFFIAFEILILAFYGFSVHSVKIVLGPDIAIIVILSILFFVRNVRLAIINQKSLGKAVMISSVLLAYSIYSLVYLFYYVLKTKYTEDTEVVYFIVSLISALLISAGIIIENKRIKKLNELKHTRKELASLYGNETKTAKIVNHPGRWANSN